VFTRITALIITGFFVIQINHAWSQLNEANFKPFRKSYLSPSLRSWWEGQISLETSFLFLDEEELADDERIKGNVLNPLNIGVGTSVLFKFGTFEKVTQFGFGFRGHYLPKNQASIGFQFDGKMLCFGKHNGFSLAGLLTGMEMGAAFYLPTKERAFYFEFYGLDVQYKNFEFKAGIRFDEFNEFNLAFRFTYHSLWGKETSF
jgi:hypothetical protein